MSSAGYSSEKSSSRLRDFEIILKQIYEKKPERHLEQPQEFEQIQDILYEANTRYPNEFIEQLLRNRLEEELFFSHDSDVEIYHHFRYLPAYWHTHSFIEVACVIQGQCIHHISGKSFLMETGDICIIAPETSHAVSAFSDDCLMRNYLLRTSTFETAFFGVLSENDILSDFFMRTLYHQNAHSYLLFRTGGDRELVNYLSLSYEEFSRNRQYRSRMLNSILNMFFITLLRNHGSNIIFPDSDSQRAGDENTILILKYMQENYSTITLSELAAFFNYSERQIQRIIKDSTGMSFSQNIQKLKLRQAVRLMQNENLSIAAISEQLGYSAPENFRHIFKKYYGMTPVEYRLTQKEGRI